MQATTEQQQRQTEERLRGGRILVGNPIRMQDGADWVVPAMPISGPESDWFLEHLARHTDLADEVADLFGESEGAEGDGKLAAVEVRVAKAKELLALEADIAFQALRLNYPGLDRERDFNGLVSRSQMPQIIHAVGGGLDLRALLGDASANPQTA